MSAEEVLMKVQVFGAFRDWVKGASFEVTAPVPLTVQQFRAVVSKQLNELNPGRDSSVLVADSVFAGSKRTLLESDLLTGSEEIVLLPPVCGG
jgi:molybdopterin converting factor small subunit